MSLVHHPPESTGAAEVEVGSIGTSVLGATEVTGASVTAGAVSVDSAPPPQPTTETPRKTIPKIANTDGRETNVGLTVTSLCEAPLSPHWIR